METNKTQENLKKLYEKLTLLKNYRHALGVINFDLVTICPVDGREEQGDIINFFTNEYFKILNAEDYKELIVYLKNHKEELSTLDKSLVDKLYDTYLKEKNVTPEFNFELTKVFTKANLDWHKAKDESNYSLFRDSFEKVIEFQEKAVNLRENKLPNLYDNLLDDCEKGILTQDLDVFFSDLKKGLLELIEKIKNSNYNVRTDFLSRKVAISKQELLSKYLLELNGFNFKSGAFTTTEHPFTSDIARHDTRITTHYHENMVLSNVYSIIHEGGHAIFMQNERDEDHDHFINDYITNGMHESVSRFYENIIGRSKEYIHLIYPKFIEIFKDEFSDITEEELYEGVNLVEPSLIRTEADEVTYGLHIIIRYEMEKMLTNHEITVDEAPEVWNSLYEKYLGVRPKNDKEGILQDVHWSSGFGYFASYAIGNAYNSIYFKTMNQEFDVLASVAKGDFKTINDWMIKHVFQHANVLSPREWIKEITGYGLTADFYLDYLNKKYKEIYKF